MNVRKGFLTKVPAHRAGWIRPNMITMRHKAVWIYTVSQLKLAERNLSKTSLTAPYDGFIAARYVEPHEEIQAGQRIFEINAEGTMQVILAVSETNISQIHLADPVTVTFPTLPGQSIKGSVTEIGSAAIKANSFPVKIALINPPADINPGMTAEASLVMRRKTN